MRLTKQPAMWEGRFIMEKLDDSLTSEEELSLMLSYLMLFHARTLAWLMSDTGDVPQYRNQQRFKHFMMASRYCSIYTSRVVCCFIALFLDSAHDEVRRIYSS